MRRIIFLTIAFIFIASSTFALISIQLSTSSDKKVSDKRKANNEYKPIPVLVGDFEGLKFSATSVYAIDIDSGLTLFEKNSDMPILPASTTKIITALVALDYYPLNSVLKVGKVSVSGQKMDLVVGEEITVENLLYGLLIFSANDAAEILAVNFPGGKDEFVASMNRKAHEIKLENTSFTNPSGFDGGDHYSTARDLVRAASFAMKVPFFAKAVGTTEIQASSIDGKFVHNLSNINELVGEVDGVLGVKTGWTENAQENLITYINRDDKRVVIALLGSNDRFSETKKLIEWIFKNYSWVEVVGPNAEGEG